LSARHFCEKSGLIGGLVLGVPDSQARSTKLPKFDPVRISAVFSTRISFFPKRNLLDYSGTPWAGTGKIRILSEPREWPFLFGTTLFQFVI
jgi:hypothetical protein